MPDFIQVRLESAVISLCKKYKRWCSDEHHGKPLNWKLSITLSTAGDGIRNWIEMTECEALKGKKESNQYAAYKTSEDNVNLFKKKDKGELFVIVLLQDIFSVFRLISKIN